MNAASRLMEIIIDDGACLPLVDSCWCAVHLLKHDLNAHRQDELQRLADWLWRTPRPLYTECLGESLLRWMFCAEEQTRSELFGGLCCQWLEECLNSDFACDTLPTELSDDTVRITLRDSPLLDEKLASLVENYLSRTGVVPPRECESSVEFCRALEYVSSAENLQYGEVSRAARILPGQQFKRYSHLARTITGEKNCPGESLLSFLCPTEPVDFESPELAAIEETQEVHAWLQKARNNPLLRILVDFREEIAIDLDAVRPAKDAVVVGLLQSPPPPDKAFLQSIVSAVFQLWPGAPTCYSETELQLVLKRLDGYESALPREIVPFCLEALLSDAERKASMKLRQNEF